MMDLSDLKPCPFCGCETPWLKYNTSRSAFMFYYVECPTCGAKSKTVSRSIHMYDDKDDPLDCDAAETVVHAWNTRNRYAEQDT